MSRCYECDDEEVEYEAHLDHDCTPVVRLCGDCAEVERATGCCVWIRSLPRVLS